jgi:uncharacterized protein YyaL (SSP411 family)
MTRLAEAARPHGKVAIGETEMNALAFRLGSAIDPVNGGLRGAPKFPQCAMFEFLWRAGLRSLHPNPPAQAGEGREGAQARGAQGNAFFELVELTLTRICEGGICDHLGGGFSRYSVDERWLVPHFEKMLYDNAQLLELLALAWQRSGNELFRQRARETVGWLTREMTTAGGAFCASLDADSEGEEGKFYVWSRADIVAVLGEEDGAFFAHHYDVTVDGNFEGRNILNRLAPRERSDADETRLAGLREKLLAARASRVRPGLDDKVLADWNGLMIAALVNAGVAFDEPSWIAMAARAFDFIARAMTRDDRLGHSWREDRLLFPGLASDFAAMIRAALALAEASGERAYLERALAWQAAFDRHYANAETDGYYLTADDAEGLVLRPAATTDDAIPNANALAAQNLVRLAALAGDDAWRAKADRLFDGILPRAQDNLFGHTALLNALDLRLRAAEIVVTGRDAQALTQAALKIPFSERIVVRAASAGDLPASHPAQQKLKAFEGSAAFICAGERCSLPVTEPADIAPAVAAMRG